MLGGVSVRLQAHTSGRVMEAAFRPWGEAWTNLLEKQDAVQAKHERDEGHEAAAASKAGHEVNTRDHHTIGLDMSVVTK